MGRDPSDTSRGHPGSWVPPGDIAQAIEAWQRLITKGYLLPGVCGSLSIKSPHLNLYGEEEHVLWVTGSNGESPNGPEGVAGLRLTGLRLDGLSRLLDLDDLPASELEVELHRARIRASDPMPAWESLLHTGFQQRCVVYVCPPALLAIASSKDGKGRLEQFTGASLGVIDFTPAGFQSARRLKRVLDSWEEEKPCYLVGFGLWVPGTDVEACFGLIEEIESKAQAYLQAHEAWDIQPLKPPSAVAPVRNRLAALRKEISVQQGNPVILNLDQGIAEGELLQKLEGVGPPTFYHAQYTRSSPIFVLREDGQEGGGSQADPQALSTQRIFLDQDLGACSAGFTPTGAFRTAALFRSTLEAWLRAEQLGGYRAFPAAELANTGSLPTPGFERAGAAVFSGEIALVTGGASGIGKACVESLLRRGAAVASIDINPDVVKMVEGAEYLGLQCDLTDEEAVLRAFEAMARRFGGLDMLVLNAGIFPGGIRIESLDLAHWQKVMNINMNSNLVILREAHPLLRLSPNGGRVLVNGSKNVLAPGAGAAAYSASKAAVTQLARVAALEWGKDRIRINMIHPDQVMDTRIWTEEVIQARAAHYGLSVQAYKTRNLLGIELNSHYVGELVAEMLGPLFEKITGAQIPVDGGSDRTI